MRKRNFRTQGPWIREYLQIPSAPEVPRILKCEDILKCVSSVVWWIPCGQYVESPRVWPAPQLFVQSWATHAPGFNLSDIQHSMYHPQKKHDCQTQHVFYGNRSTKLAHPHSAHGQCEFEKALLSLWSLHHASHTVRVRAVLKRSLDAVPGRVYWTCCPWEP